MSIVIEEDDDDDFRIIKKLKHMEEHIMANLQDLQTALTALAANVTTLVAKEATFETDVTATLNKLDAKIAELQAQVTAGSETQPLIDSLVPVNQAISDASAKLDSADAAVKVEGQ